MSDRDEVWTVRGSFLASAMMYERKWERVSYGCFELVELQPIFIGYGAQEQHQTKYMRHVVAVLKHVDPKLRGRRWGIEMKLDRWSHAHVFPDIFPGVLRAQELALAWVLNIEAAADAVKRLGAPEAFPVGSGG